MVWTIGIELALLQETNRQTRVVNGKKILFIWHEEQAHAVQSQCPHLKLPLKNATINEDNALVCPFHRSAFDLETGDVKCWATWPAVVSPLLCAISRPKNLPVYQTRLEEGNVLVDID